MNNFDNKNKGISILGLLFFGVILILTLSYFNISIRGVVESPAGQDNINYIKGESRTIWERYLKDPAHYLWQDVWVNIFWKSFISNMERLRDGEPTDIENAANRLKL